MKPRAETSALKKEALIERCKMLNLKYEGKSVDECFWGFLKNQIKTFASQWLRKKKVIAFTTLSNLK